ncbi:MAG: mannose-1-phosphate guanylyltransferase [Qipengyuania sp.]
MTTIHPVILCGGSGTRLWPRSRKHRPKPFLPLLGEGTLFEQTLARTCDAGRFAPPVIVAGAAHTPLIEAQRGLSDGARLIIEPAAKSTAPAIALAAHVLPDDAIMLVCPSDHHIADEQAFRAGVESAAALAREDWLVCFGIAPTSPETGYGYIRKGEPVGEGHRVERFVEKPDLHRAQTYLADGGYVWNGGIFVFQAGVFLRELERCRPAMAVAVAQSVERARIEGWQVLPSLNAFAAIDGESVDYAVMEPTDRAAVVSAQMGWSDIGNWDALMEARESDDGGNVVRGRADLLDSSGVMVESDGPRVSVVGLSDVIVVVDGDEVLVTSRAKVGHVGKLPGASQQ